MTLRVGLSDQYAAPVPGARFDAVVFDKDGTLVAFHPTWDAAFGEMLAIVADGDDSAREAAAAAVGYDLVTGTIPDDSPIIAESSATLAAMMAPALGRGDGEAFVREVDRLLASLSLDRVTAEAGADAALAALAAAGVETAVVTNDSEGTARLQVERLGWAGHFAAVIGHDSGHGSKPDAAPVLACLRELGVEPARAALVGDSRHDLHAARAAGVTSVLVGDLPLLSPEADLAIADLGALPEIVLG